MFNNSLLYELNNYYLKTSICGKKIGAIAYADDIALMSRSEIGIQALINIAYKHSRKWRYEFNASKCSMLIFSNKKSECASLNLSKEKIPLQLGEKHLGTYLSNSSDATIKFWRSRVQSCKSLCYCLQGLGSYRVPVNPVLVVKYTIKHVYRNYVMESRYVN